MTLDPNSAAPDFEREKWLAAADLQRRELALKEREQANRDADTALRQREAASSKWRSPLVVAILAAAVAGGGNAVVALVNGNWQYRLESSRSESNRILEMIKTGNPESAANNLEFLLKSGLVSDPHLTKDLKEFLKNRTTGSGPSLPAPDGRIAFERSDLLTRPMQGQLEELFARYFKYLDTAGFPHGPNKISIRIQRSSPPNAFYDGEAIVIDPRLSEDPAVALREYNHFLLGNKPKIDWQGQYSAMESGAADYFACSFLDNPKFGQKAAKVYEFSSGYIRDLDNRRRFSEFRTLTEDQFPYRGAEIWGGAMWALREKLGQENADAIIAGAWLATSWPERDQLRAAAFVKALLAAARSRGTNLLQMTESVLKDRGFPLSP